MRRHGWGGNPPSSDAEAMARILEAALASVEERGGDADMADVATRLGVTRQTIYRYFPTRHALFMEATNLAQDAFVNRARRVMARHDSPLEQTIHGLLFAARELPRDRQLSVLFERDVVAATLLSPEAFDACRGVLDALGLVPPLPADGVDKFCRLALGALVTLLLDSWRADEPEDVTLDFLRFVFAPSYAAAPAG